MMTWERTFGAAEVHEQFASVQQTADNGFIITGSTRSIDAIREPKVYLVKAHSNGDFDWDSNFSGCAPGEGAIGYSVQQTFNDGDPDGYIVGGQTGTTGPGPSNLLLLKTDLRGNVDPDPEDETTWKKKLGTEGRDFGGSVQQTTDGGYIVAGRSGDWQAYLVKTHSNGDLDWENFYSGGGGGCCRDGRTSDSRRRLRLRRLDAFVAGPQ